MKIIPAIDLRQGGVVRLRQGDFARSRRFDVDPETLARRYLDAGADWLHVVDLDGARTGRPSQTGVLAALVTVGAELQWGGGVRTGDHVRELLGMGVARVVVGSVAASQPRTFTTWLERFGSDRLCLALDMRQDAGGQWRVAVDAWQGESAVDAVELLTTFSKAGLVHVLCTDIGRDGLASGPNVDLYCRLAGDWPGLSWIASGGVRDLDDVQALAATGVAGCVAGTALLEGSLPLSALR